jgi:hypothetical protein
MSMEDMTEYLPVRVRDFQIKGEGSDPTFDSVVLADITDDDDEGMGMIEIGFTVKGVRRYVAFRKFDLRNALGPAPTSKSEQP